MTELSYGILIGGKSRRMGTDKAFLKLHEQTFLECIAKEFEGRGNLMVSGKHHQRGELPYTFIADEQKEIGPIEGILNILRNSKTEYVFICACDMPFLRYELVEYIKEYVSSDYDCYVITDGERLHPLCSIYSIRILPILEGMIAAGNYKLMDIFKLSFVKYIDIRKSCYPIKYIENINTKEEYEQIRNPILFCVSGRKNSGKTTLIRKLIAEYKKRNYKVGVIKHDGHDFMIDHEGTDTYMFAQAGADEIAIYSAQKSAFIKKRKDQNAEDIIAQMQDMDIIIIEGLKNSTYPKIEVLRIEESEELIAKKETIFAVIINENTEKNKDKVIDKNMEIDENIKNKANDSRTFSIYEPKKIADFILEYFHNMDKER